jgi:hypothetical protein
MRESKGITARRVMTAAERERALAVLGATYRDEKRWVAEVGEQLPAEELARPDVSWFLAAAGEEPVGVLRVLYSPPLHLYREYGLELLDRGFDVEAFLRANRIAEIGRFAVAANERRSTGAALALIREAIAETVLRGWTHFVTDVFEEDPHSPYQFHTRVLGFVPVATHESGELACASRRITLLLDLRDCYRRLRASNGFFYRAVTEGWSAELHERLGAPAVPLPVEEIEAALTAAAG